MSDKLQQALAAVESGDKVTAQRLLADLVSSDPKNESAWLLLASVVTDKGKKRECFARVRAVNPDNAYAARQLAELERQTGTAERQPGPRPVVGKKCPQCGVTNQDEARFCSSCGKALAEGVQQQPIPAVAPQPAEPVAKAKSSLPRVPAKRRKSRWGLIILAVTLFGAFLLCLTCALGRTLFVSEPSESQLGSPTRTPEPDYDPIQARGACAWYVENALKSPSTADFLFHTEKVFRIEGEPDNYRLVRGAVDAQNSYGATITTWYECIVYYDSAQDEWFLFDLSIEE